MLVVIVARGAPDEGQPRDQRRDQILGETPALQGLHGGLLDLRLDDASLAEARRHPRQQGQARAVNAVVVGRPVGHRLPCV